MFAAGDLVEYTGKHREYNEPEKVGERGTVVDVSPRGVMATVRWDNSAYSQNTCYSANLGLLSAFVDETESFFVA